MNFTNIRGKQCRIMWSQRDPRLRQSGKGNIFVKNLHESIDNKTLYDTFSVFGNILSCKVATDRDTGKSRGYGYVHYVDDKSAKKAIDGVNGMTISEKKVHAELFKPIEQRKKAKVFTNVYVKYIPRSFGEQQLKELFERETGGSINSSKYWDHKFGVSACLNFVNVESAVKAVEVLNGREMKDESLDDNKEMNDEKDGIESKDNKTVKLYVARAQEKKEREENLRRIARKRGQRGGQAHKGTNLYIKNLSPDVDDLKLKDMFSQYGVITSAKVMVDATTKKSRGFGFVAFKEKDAATRAMHEMNSSIYNGKPLYVSRAQSKAFRQQFIQKQLRNKNRMRQQGPPYYQQRIGPYGPQFPQQTFPYGQPNIRQFGPPQGIQQRPMPFMYNRLNPQQLASFQNPQLSQLNNNPIPPMSTQNLLVQSQFGSQQNPGIFGRQSSGIQQQVGVQSQQQTSNSNAPAQSGSIYQNQPRPPNYSTGVVPVQSQPTAQSVPQQQQSVSAVSTGQTSAPMLENQPLTTDMLSSAKPAERKRLIGERLFPKIQVVEPRLAGKITGMLLEMDNTELLILLGDQQALMNKINEALAVLKDHQQKQSQSNVASGGNSQQNASQQNRASQKNASQSNQNV